MGTEISEIQIIDFPSSMVIFPNVFCGTNTKLTHYLKCGFLQTQTFSFVQKHTDQSNFALMII